MQVDVHRIDPEVARADLADDRVEVRPVAIDEPARGVDRVGDRLHVALEQAAGVGVGDHHPRHVGAEARLERFEVDPAVGVRGNVLHPVAGEGGGRRIGAVRAFGHEDNLARVAPRLERGADAQDAAQLAVRARLGAHGDAVHAGEVDQPEGELVDYLERAAHGRDRLERMHVGEAGHARDFLVQPRIVLHRAAAEREEPEVDRVVLAAEAGVVADRLGLGQAGQADRPGAFHPAETVRAALDRGQVDAGGVVARDLEDQRLFEHQCAVAGGGARTLVHTVAGSGHLRLPA